MTTDTQWEALCDELRNIGAEDVTLMEPTGVKCRKGGYWFEITDSIGYFTIACLDEADTDDDEGMWEWLHVDTIADVAKKIAAPFSI